MNVLVVGSGSIGFRHISNLLALGANVSVFSYRGNTSIHKDIDDRLRFYSRWSDVFKDHHDAVVIANSTEKHIDIAIEAAEKGIHLYIEKPLSNSLVGVGYLSNLIDKKKLIVECGFMLRTHPNLQWIKNKLNNADFGEVMHIHASVGQWLPDWRPLADYKRGYGAFKAQGGGVIFDLIHELDLIHWLAGPVSDVAAMKRDVECLEIETESIAQIGLRMSSGVLAQVHLDYVRPNYNRSLEIVCRNGIIFWDYMSGTVYFEGSGLDKIIANKVPENFVRNTMFSSLMAHFISRIKNQRIEAISSFEDSVQVLCIALASHIASNERKNIRPSDLNCK